MVRKESRYVSAASSTLLLITVSRPESKQRADNPSCVFIFRDLQVLKEHQETEENWWVIDDSDTRTEQNHLRETIKDKCEALRSRIKSGGVPLSYESVSFPFIIPDFCFNFLQTNCCLRVFSIAGWWRRTGRERISTFTCTEQHNHITITHPHCCSCRKSFNFT